MDALSCLAPLPYTSFTDADLARALFSMAADSSPSSAAALLADCGGGGGHGGVFASATPAMITCESVVVADSARPSPAGGRLGPAGGRAGKRRSRASKRAPTTYISTDPSNFRLMVQQVTGVQADLVLPPTAAAFDVVSTTPHAAALEQAALQQQQQQQQPCFPTLDSWSVMYEGS
ncbi:hypothetical protein GUJ93_ZPchr0013g36947 [Zizania palustris]|uniref:VQ domain-containing protein n=1 Tax=Zizania palustris TaxID=103762 RepID=A0A8J5X0B7_ZIZPA|nr:hypothetical protein GUJ93_ZPchr0013g36947 [Zizania palustris]